MGNRICRKRRSGIEERFTRPQRLIRQPSDVDYKRLRKLILSQKLAPCFDGVEDSHPDLEECPICFFYYPSLNRSTCCRKRVCTECFLQMKPSNASRPAQCPFCKCSSYAVEFRGAQTEEEKRKELAEEQKVIEAKMRIRRRESQNDQSLFLEQISSNEELQSSGPQHSAGDLHQVGGHRVEASTGQMTSWSPERRGAFSQDYEEIMIMEAIWRSLQEIDLQANTSEQSSASSGSVEAQDSNQILSSTSLVGVGNLPGESVIERVAISIACTDEHGQSTVTQTGQGPDSSSEVEYGDLKNETRSIADSRGEESEAGSEIECLASYSFTSDNDSWSLSHSIQEGGQNLLREVSSDADAVDSSDTGSSLCSIHELSDRTPQYTDDEVEPCCSVLSSPVSL